MVTERDIIHIVFTLITVSVTALDDRYVTGRGFTFSDMSDRH